MRLSHFARRRYTPAATPLQFLPRLTSTLGGPNIFIKRDDLLGLAAGGNKTRKLEFLMAEALALHADTIITTGGVQSNHCRLTLSASAIEGLKRRIVLVEHTPGSFEPTATGNNLLFRLIGSDQLAVVPHGTDPIVAMMGIAAEVTASGGRPYIIPAGGSSALGTLGYVRCAEEILAQSLEMSLAIDHVVCASGSGGTQAGLIAGFIGNQSGVAVTGISVSATRTEQEKRVFDLAKESSALAGSAIAIRRNMIVALDDFVGEGYSLPTTEMAETVTLFARTEGILLDPVYTGKAAAGLIDMVHQGAFKKNSNVVFVHTGGSPVSYSYGDALLSGHA